MLQQDLPHWSFLFWLVYLRAVFFFFVLLLLFFGLSFLRFVANFRLQAVPAARNAAARTNSTAST